MGADLAHYFDFCNSLPSVMKDVILAHDAEGVSSRDALRIGTIVTPPDALTEASHLVRIRALPGNGELGMALKVAILKRLARLFVDHGVGEVEEEGLGIMAACDERWAHGRYRQ